MKPSPFPRLVASLLCILFVTDSLQAQHKTNPKNSTGSNLLPLDTLVLEQGLGMKGKYSNGEYKITIPQNDLDVRVDSFQIIPAMGLSTWVAFTPTTDGAMLMGDLVLTETDLKPVQAEVIHQGLTISAIHNHFVRNHPNVVYMHIGGSGPADELARKARAVLDKIRETRGGDPARGTASSGTVVNRLDTRKLDEILHATGELN